MRATITSLKGGVGKTVSSIHIAACLAMRGTTALIDGDMNQSSLDWARAGDGLPFEVVAISEARKYLASHKPDHIVVDTAAAPSDDSLKILARDTDLLILPTKPDAISLRALIKTIKILKDAKANNFKVLLTMVSPSRKVGEMATESLSNQGIPIFKSQIRLYSAYEIAATNGCLVHQARDSNGRKVSNSGIAWSDYPAVGNEL